MEIILARTTIGDTIVGKLKEDSEVLTDVCIIQFTKDSQTGAPKALIYPYFAPLSKKYPSIDLKYLVIMTTPEQSIIDIYVKETSSIILCR